MLVALWGMCLLIFLDLLCFKICIELIRILFIILKIYHDCLIIGLYQNRFRNLTREYSDMYLIVNDQCTCMG